MMQKVQESTFLLISILAHIPKCFCLVLIFWFGFGIAFHFCFGLRFLVVFFLQYFRIQVFFYISKPKKLSAMRITISFANLVSFFFPTLTQKNLLQLLCNNIILLFQTQVKQVS